MDNEVIDGLERMSQLAIGSTVVLAAGLTMIVAFRGQSSATRHLAGTLTCLALLFLPAAIAAVPSWPLGWVSLDGLSRAGARFRPAGPVGFATPGSTVPVSNAPLASPADTRTMGLPSSTLRGVSLDAMDGDEILAGPKADGIRSPGGKQTTSTVGRAAQRAGDKLTATQQTMHLSYAIYFIGIYLSGVVFGMTRLVADHLSAKRLVARSNDFLTDCIAHETKESAMMCSGKTVGIRVSDQVSVPMVTGLVRPTVLLPMSAPAWPADQLGSVIAHELAHLERRDLAAQLIARLAAIFYWPQPLVHLLNHRIRIDREAACDDHVVAGGRSPSQYARHLLNVATELRRRRIDRNAALAMARSSEVEQRINAVLNPARRRTPPTNKVIALMLAWILAGLLGSALVSPFSQGGRLVIAQEQSAAEQTAADAEQGDVAVHKEIENEIDGYRARGRVTDSEGRPVAGAFLIAQSYQRDLGVQFVSATTNPRGEFEMVYPSDALAHDMFHTWTYAPGHAIRVVMMRKLLRQSRQVNDVVIELPKPQPMNFRVLLPDGSPCSDAIVAPEGMSIPNGVLIADEPTGLHSSLPEELMKRVAVETNESGEVQIDCMPKALFNSVCVTSTHYGKQEFSTRDGEFRLREAGAIRGKVIVDAPERFAATQVMLETTQVSRSEKKGSGKAKTQLDANGEFFIPAIATGRIEMFRLIWDDRASVHPIHDQTHQQLVNAGETLELSVQTAPVVTLHGQVLFEDTQEPVGGAKVYMRNVLSPSHGSHTEADDEGRYSIKVPAGEIHQQITSLGDRDSSNAYDYPRLGNLVVSSDSSSMELKPILVSRQKVVHGRLRDASGDPIAERTVVLHTGNYRHLAGSARTGQDGRFQMPVSDWQIRQDKQYLKERSYWAVLEQPANGAAGPVYSALAVIDENPDAMVLETQ